MSKRSYILAAVIILGTLFWVSCAAGTNPTVDIVGSTGKTAGFWSGFWHGIISPVTFFISLLSDKVNIYEVHNSGNWYDFGFMLGLCVILDGGAHGAKRRFKKSASTN